MKLEITQAKLDGNEIEVVAKLHGSLHDIAQKAEKNEYGRYNAITRETLDKIATAVAEEYLAQNKMELINSIKKEDIVNAIQLKMIENFSIHGK